MSSIGKLVPPPSLPPEVLRFLVWLDKTEGRDKLYRLIVYASKLIVDSLRPYSVTAQTADIVQRLERGAAVVATSRKLFRMFRSLEYLQAALESFALADPLERAASSLKGCSLAVWLLCDHIQWLSRAGYVRLQPLTLRRLDAYHSQAWFSGLLLAAVLALYRLQQLARQEQAVVTAAGSLNNGSATAQLQRQLAAIQLRKAKHIIDVVKNGTDLVIPAARLGWIDASGQTVGLAGTITSLIGIWQTYPSKE